MLLLSRSESSSVCDSFTLSFPAPLPLLVRHVNMHIPPFPPNPFHWNVFLTHFPSSQAVRGPVALLNTLHCECGFSHNSHSMLFLQLLRRNEISTIYLGQTWSCSGSVGSRSSVLHLHFFIPILSQRLAACTYFYTVFSGPSSLPDNSSLAEQLQSAGC